MINQIARSIVGAMCSALNAFNLM